MAGIESKTHPEIRFNLNAQVSQVLKQYAVGSPVVSEEPGADKPSQRAEKNALSAVILSNAFTAGEKLRRQGKRGKYGLLDVVFVGANVEECKVVDALPRVPQRGIYSVISGKYGRSVNELLESIDHYMLYTMRYDIRQECDRMAALPPSHPDNKKYRRLEELTKDDVKHRMRVNKETAFLFTARPGTGTKTLRQTVQVLYAMHKTKGLVPPTMGELSDLLRNNYVLHARFASGHMDIHLPAMLTLEDDIGRFRKKYFREGETARGKRLDIPKWQEFVEAEWDLQNATEEKLVTVTCPALASSGLIQEEPLNKNVIDGTVNWYADILATV